MSKTIYLGWRSSHPITVSEEGYAALQELVVQYRICSQCSASYTETNPMVLENVCLHCVIAEQQHLTFVGSIGEPDEDGYQGYKFLDAFGNVFLSSSRYSSEPGQDSYQTLMHWNFPVPTSYKPPHSTTEVTLFPGSWSIYGDVRSSVVVIEKTYDQKHSCSFLTYKGGAFRELTRRDSDMKRLLDQAVDIVEESKDTEGYYHFGGYLTRYRRDSAVYEVAAQIAAAVYDVKTRLSQNGREAAQQKPERDEEGAS